MDTFKIFYGAHTDFLFQQSNTGLLVDKWDAPSNKFIFRITFRKPREYLLTHYCRRYRFNYTADSSSANIAATDTSIQHGRNVLSMFLGRRMNFLTGLLLAGSFTGFSAIACAQATATAPADATPLGTPAMVGPIAASAPHMIDGGPFGQIAINGVFSGFGAWQSHPVAGDQGGIADISNGQVFVQKAAGKIQYYFQAGAYNFPSLGTPLSTTANIVSGFYGPLPMAYIKLVPNNAFSFQAGKLPSMLGAEDTFSFQNIDIERGLLWNQENSITRAVQLNYAVKKLSASLSWGDGFYSNRWNWLTGSMSYAFSAANSVTFAAGGNFGNTNYSTSATPAAQNNSTIYDLTYTHTAKKWMLQPYFQFTHVSEHPQIGIFRTTSTQGEAILGYYTLPHHMSLGGRFEFISSTGNAAEGAANLLYGAGSNALSLTVTPTYQRGVFFARGDVSFVHAGSTTPGAVFGPHGTDNSQVRGLLEAGFLF